MSKNSADRQANAVDPHPVTPESEKQTAKRRRLQNALEDDDVYEALMSLHAQNETKSND
jgi:hypothetical protein